MEKRRECIESRHCLASWGIPCLSFDLLPSPASSFDRSWLEVTVSLDVFDENSEPFLTEQVGIFTVGKGVS